MSRNIIEGQLNKLEQGIMICLKKRGCTSDQKIKPEMLSLFITLSYCGILFKALLNGDKGKIKDSEKKIDDMVDFYLKYFKY